MRLIRFDAQPITGTPSGQAAVAGLNGNSGGKSSSTFAIGKFDLTSSVWPTFINENVFCSVSHFTADTRGGLFAGATGNECAIN